MVGETNALGPFLYTYDGATTRVNAVTYPNGQTTAYSYYDHQRDDRVQTIHNRFSNGATLSKFDYTYDAIGNILSWRQQAGNAPPIQWTYSYDAADQLLTAVESTTDSVRTVLKRYAYTYDPAANRVTQQIDEVVITSVYDSLNRLTNQQPGGRLRVVGTVNEPANVTIQGSSVTPDSTGRFEGTVATVSGTDTFSVTAVDSSGNARTQAYQLSGTGTARTFQHDANGNVTFDGARTLEWDARNQLASVTTRTHRTEFTYDGFRRRVKTIEKENGSTVAETRAVWCEIDLCEERGADGTTVVARPLQQGEQRAGTISFFTLDHLGSVRDVTDNAQAVVARYDFAPFGRRSLLVGTDVTPAGYTGQRQMASSDLSLTLFRAYNTDVGTWMSEDPLGQQAGQNFYAYVNQRPTVLRDPLGLIGEIQVVTAAASACVTAMRRNLSNHCPQKEPRGRLGLDAGFADTHEPVDLDRWPRHAKVQGEKRLGVRGR